MSSTLRKSLRIVEYFASADGPRGITDVSRALAIEKSAVQRVIRTLNETGYLERAPDTSKYRLSLKLWELGSLIIARHEARRHVHPILRFGARVSGFTAFFTFADYPDIIYLDKVEGIHGRTYSAEPGNRLNMRLTAGGKAVLAYLPESMRNEICSIGPNDGPIAGMTASRRKELQRELTAIKRRMFAVSEGGTVPGVNSVAAAVWRPGPIPLGSVVLTADAANMPAAGFDELGATVISMAEEATRALGGELIARDHALSAAKRT